MMMRERKIRACSLVMGGKNIMVKEILHSIVKLTKSYGF